MKFSLSLLTLVAAFSVVPAFAADDVHVKCDYAYMGFPTSTVEVTLFSGSKLSSSVTVTMQGSSHKESLTEEVKADGEYLHGWISKENPQNTIELIVYKVPQADGQSKLVNHNVPIAQDMWGTCTGVPAE